MYTDYLPQFESLENGQEVSAIDTYISGYTPLTRGRIIARRVMGKLAFLRIRDIEGEAQLYIDKSYIGEEYFNLVKRLKLGDIIEFEWEVVKRTDKGELSFKPKNIKLLVECKIPLPDKWHGLTDIETRYRQRYLDLITNKEVIEIFKKRATIIRIIRNFLDDRNFIEVDTPILDTRIGGAEAKPFITHHNTLDMDLYMRIAPELNLKRLLVGGFDAVYELGKVFRNEGVSTKHNPEFTSIEIYKAYENYEYMMDLCEGLIHRLKSTNQPFNRVTMVQAVEEVTGVNFDSISYEEAVDFATSVNLTNLPNSKRLILVKVFEELVEPTLIEPTFITHYPIEVSPLAKEDGNYKGYTERFELYINGMEMANGFTELNDPDIQRERFQQQALLKSEGNDEIPDADEDFIKALEYGMPPAGGLGIGIDRLVMYLTNSKSIKDVILFPLMKHEN